MAIAFIALIGCDNVLDSWSEEDNIPPPGPGMARGFPAQWGGSSRNGQFEVGTDFDVYRGGRYSAYIRTLTRRVLADQFGALTQSVRADAYRGSRVRLSGWIRTAGLTGAGAGLWLRSDGAGPQPFDNMSGRRLLGTNDWREVSIVADIPEDAIGMAFGAIMVSPGTIWVDDLRLDVVDANVPVTASPIVGPADTAAVAQQYDRVSMGPRNLDFEGVFFPASVTETVSWVRDNSFAFLTDDPNVPSSDLDPLRNLVGNASIVALGEATHGTREFFRMKHRMLEWLVREMGFSYFGIEATFPEALDVDHYVQTGEGDPSLLLANLYFWTWNTDEVLELIKWMRSWNAAGRTPRVHFVGFDMQFPGHALDSVQTFVTRMDSASAVEVQTAYGCLNQLREYPTRTGSAGLEDYPRQTPGYKVECRLALQRVDTLMARREAEWGAREGLPKARLVRHMARLVSQWEETNAGDAPSAFAVRDRSMAENIAWWHDTQAPGAKMVLWAHNVHIARLRNHMGDHLSQRYGPGYLVVGQTFGTGTFNAVRLGAPIDTLPPLRPHTLATYRDESIESVFLNTGLPRLIFDARRVSPDTTAGSKPLTLPMSIRAIGSGYSPLFNSAVYVWPLVVRNDYDLLVWFETTTASVLRPFPELTPLGSWTGQRTIYD